MKRMFRALSLLLASVTVFSLFGCAFMPGNGGGTIVSTTVTEKPSEAASVSSTAPEEAEPEETETTESSVGELVDASAGVYTGKIILELYPEYAPQTVANFMSLVHEGFYTGLTFGRIVDGYVAQGGKASNGAGRKVESIFGEFAANGFTHNILSHTRGAISMTRGSDYDSGDSEFFICYSDKFTSEMDGNYAAFGYVVEGMEIIDDLCNTERALNSIGEKATPTSPVTIGKTEELSGYVPAGGSVGGHYYVQMSIIYFK